MSIHFSYTIEWKNSELLVVSSMNIQFLHHNNKGKNQEHVVKFIYGHFIYHPCNCQKHTKKSILQKRKVLQFGKLTLRENKGSNFPLVSFVGWRLWKTTFATSVLGTLDVVTFLVLTTFRKKWNWKMKNWKLENEMILENFNHQNDRGKINKIIKLLYLNGFDCVIKDIGEEIKVLYSLYGL
jgi:hypothetical protein